MHGYGDLPDVESVEFELVDRESGIIIFEAGNAKDMAAVIRLSMEIRPDKVDNLYLIAYNTYNGRRDRDEWDAIAEGAEELDVWMSKHI